MSIIIGADLVPTKSNMKYFEEGKIENLIDKELLKKLQEVDYRIFNLEVPLTDKETPIIKCGPNLIASTKSILGIKKIGVNFFTLANNHILDQGEEGLRSTINILKKNNIEFAGAGENLNSLKKSFIFELKKKKIGIYCCAEHEFSIATLENMGANPFDLLESLDYIEKLKKEVDYLIVLYHGGKEHYRYPSPNLQKVCRKMIEKGVDLVICQHSHCIGCEEKWKNGIIVYGQGNFLFDDEEDEYWQTSLLIEIKENFQVEYIPIEKNKCSVKLAQKNKEKILKEFYRRSEEIKQEKFIKEEYEKIAKKEFFKYLNMIQGNRYNSLFFRILNKISGYRLKESLVKKIYLKKEITKLCNILECEVHRETFLNAIKINLRDKEEKNK